MSQWLHTGSSSTPFIFSHVVTYQHHYVLSYSHTLSTSSIGFLSGCCLWYFFLSVILLLPPSPLCLKTAWVENCCGITSLQSNQGNQGRLKERKRGEREMGKISSSVIIKLSSFLSLHLISLLLSFTNRETVWHQMKRHSPSPGSHNHRNLSSLLLNNGTYR